ncbi:LysR family transcriptional regulator [Sulfitobacter geojensis]|uniref:LysR family transcriptional regulator n=1 Tax=Sulfitobacter geojensis TaxID=1342299 RepID=UPI0036D9B124
MIGHHLNLKQLEALVWVADLGSFRKAAHHLNTTQPNISARIAGLEKTLGLPLMLRDAGSVRMTPRGTEVLAQARVTLREAARLVEIADRADLVDDRLRLGVTELVAATWLRPLMVRLNETYPNVSVELTVDLSRNLDRELASNALDLAIQTAPFGTEVSGEIELGEYGYVWVAAPALARQFGVGDVPIDSMLKHPILTHTRYTQAYLEVVDHFDTKPTQPMRIVPCNSLSAAMHMAIERFRHRRPAACVAGPTSDRTERSAKFPILGTQAPCASRPAITRNGQHSLCTAPRIQPPHVPRRFGRPHHRITIFDPCDRI